MFSTKLQDKLSKNDVPILSMPDMCIGGLTGAPGDITRKHCLQKKRGTSHINIKPYSNVKNGS